MLIAVVQVLAQVHAQHRWNPRYVAWAELCSAMSGISLGQRFSTLSQRGNPSGPGVSEAKVTATVAL